MFLEFGTLSRYWRTREWAEVLSACGFILRVQKIPCQDLIIRLRRFYSSLRRFSSLTTLSLRHSYSNFFEKHANESYTFSNVIDNDLLKVKRCSWQSLIRKIAVGPNLVSSTSFHFLPRLSDGAIAFWDFSRKSFARVVSWIEIKFGAEVEHKSRP